MGRVDGLTAVQKHCLDYSNRIYWDKSSYKSEDEYQQELVNSGIFEYVIRNENASCALAIHNKTLYFIVPGTNDLSDLKEDLRVVKKTYMDDCPGMVADGFYTHASKLLRHVRDYLEDNEGQYNINFDRVVFTGHSLGGVVALILGMEAFILYPYIRSRMEIHTIGAPRGIDRQAANWISKRLAGRMSRMITPGDPVHALPTPIRYSHPDGRVVITEKKIVIKEVNNWISLGVRTIFHWLVGFFTRASKHNASGYYRMGTKHKTTKSPPVVSPADGAYFITRDTGKV